MTDKRKDIFSSNTLETPSKKTDVFEEELDYEDLNLKEELLSEEPLDRGKIEEEPSEEDILSRTKMKEKKGKKRKNKLIIIFTMLILATVSGFTSYKFLDSKLGNTEANKELLYTKFKKVFTDDEYVEIEYNISKKSIDEIKELYEKIPESTTKTQFKNWLTTLETQFENQENAKEAIMQLYEGSQDFIKETATDSDLSEAETLLNQKFNHKYQNELISDFQKLKEQYKEMYASIIAVQELSDKEKLNTFTNADFQIILGKIEKNPNTQLKDKQKTVYNSALASWEKEQVQKQEEIEKQEEERRKQEEEQLQKEIEEARKEAEYNAKIEAEREQARQEAFAKEQERLEQERLQKEYEQKLEQERLEQERLEQEKKEQEENNKNNSSQTNLSENE